MEVKLGRMYKTRCGDLIKVISLIESPFLNEAGFYYNFIILTSPPKRKLVTKYLKKNGRYADYNHEYNVVNEVNSSQEYLLEE